MAGLIVGVPSLRLKGDYLAIVTLGFGQIIVVFLNNIEAVGGARGYSGIPIVKSFFWIFLIAILTIVIVYNIVNSAFGRALISIREDELAAEAMGVNTTRYKVMAFVISSAMAGAGGVLLAHFDGYLNPKSFEFIKSFEILIMIILGGLGSIVGSVLGAILLTVLPEALRGFAEYRMVIYSLLLIILMITRPQGLLGSTAAFKGWRGRKKAKSRTEAEEITAEDTRDTGRLKKRRSASGRVKHRSERETRSEHEHYRSCTRANGYDTAVLKTDKATIRFGGLVAVSELDMAVRQGEIYGLIGPNGAGKTTIFNLLPAFTNRPPARFISKASESTASGLTKSPAHGVSRTFQNIRLFPSMTVLDNVMTACHIHTSQTLLDAVLRTPRFSR